MKANFEQNMEMQDNGIPFFNNGFNSEYRMDERNMAYAILYYPPRQEVLCLKWHGQTWKTFVMGGIEQEDTGNPENTAIREIKEETGYTSFKKIAVLGKLDANYAQPEKKVNRVSHVTAFLFELEDDQAREAIAESEKNKHECVWIKIDDVENYLTIDTQQYIWDLAKKTKYLQTEISSRKAPEIGLFVPKQNLVNNTPTQDEITLHL